jgi:short-subunit dehydrogenase
MSTFHKKVVWITGAGSGLGKAMTIAFGKQDAILVLSGRRTPPLEALRDELIASGVEAYALPCDVSEEERIEEAVQTIIKEYNQIDVVIANAGFSVSGPFSKLNAEDWSRQLQVNVVGLTQTVRYALPHLLKTKGRVVLIGSVAAFAFAPKASPYCASKAAVHAIGESLALELYGTGVTCTTIHPGFVESDIARVDNNGVFHPEAKDKRPAKLMWKSEDAARVMLRAIKKRKRIYVFTWHGKLGAFLGRHVPGLVYFIQTRFSSWK